MRHKSVGTGGLVATRSPRGKTILNRFLTLSVSLRYPDCPRKVIPYDILFLRHICAINIAMHYALLFTDSRGRLSLRFVPQSHRLLKNCILHFAFCILHFAFCILHLRQHRICASIIIRTKMSKYFYIFCFKLLHFYFKYDKI